MSITLTIPVNEPVSGTTEKPYLSLKEKWRAFTDKKRSEKRSPFIPRMYYCLMATTMLYNSLTYLVPHSFNDWGENEIYYMKVLVCFVCVNCVSNFVCLICYDSSLKKARDRPELPHNRWEKPPDRFVPYLVNQSENGRRVQNGGVTGRRSVDVDHKDGLPWTYCEICQLDLPPRAAHCKTCNKCILKRDHHCYLTGVCVGHYNQRYFIMLSFFTMVSCAWCFYLTWSYVTSSFWGSVEYLDFFPPYSIYRMAIYDIEPHQFVMIHHLWILPLFTLAGVSYFFAQVVLVAANKTLYEFAKEDKYRSTTTISRNFRSVFGDFWLLNFIFPAQILFPQSDDGFFWEGLKLDHVHCV